MTLSAPLPTPLMTSLLDNGVDQTATPSVDLFGLGRERFQEEQKRNPWKQALIAFLRDGALALPVACQGIPDGSPLRGQERHADEEGASES
ncbi:unnamed protein product [Phytophthora fragariaefolia]|uniref:Unnamed protein product n=1 Tax=Phytophthora fragariaefolia TaxID=1490495 RepID=A0A9W6WQF9_9STRA|nr:unnamed protein product [Phytophthora fragariaefolia]